MRTKTLLLTAALGAAGVSSAIAQVYSVNAVGYVNAEAKAGFNLFANPLNTGNNTLAEVLPVVPANTALYTFSTAAGYLVYTYEEDDNGVLKWPTPTVDAPGVIAPGTGFFLRVPAVTTVTFVGEVPQGTLNTPLEAGFNLVGSKVPQAGKLQADLGYVPVEDPGVGLKNGDTVYKYDTAAGYTSFEYGELDNGSFGWLPEDRPQDQPDLRVAEGIWIRKGAKGSWNRTFSVNP